jgi:hypothetical protein
LVAGRYLNKCWAPRDSVTASCIGAVGFYWPAGRNWAEIEEKQSVAKWKRGGMGRFLAGRVLIVEQAAQLGVARVLLIIAQLVPPNHDARPAEAVIGAGYRFAIRTRPNKRFELTVRNTDDEPISLTTCGELGIELHAAAEFLIDHAYGVLFDPLPW